MSSNPKQLLIDIEENRETVCRIVGTKQSLLLLAQDLSVAAQQLPERVTSSQVVQLPGWEQQTLQTWEDGIIFQAEPDLAAYVQRRCASRSRLLPWLHGVLGVILIALAFIGLRTVWFWVF